MSIVWIPIGYEAVAREPRWASAKEIVLREVVPVEIPSRSDVELPVAIGGTRTYRHDGENWWKPVLDPVGAPLTRFPDPASTTAWQDYPFSCPTPFSKHAHSPSGKADIKHSSRTGRLAEVTEQCRQLCFVDGDIWRRCPEPIIAVSFAEPSLMGKITIDVIPADQDIGDSALFRIDEGEDVANFIKSLRAQGLGEGPIKPRVQLLRDVPIAINIFALRAASIRDAFIEVVELYPVNLDGIEDDQWQRCLEQSEGDNDWEFLDAIETASECEDSDICAVMEYLIRHDRALLWRQVEADLEAARLQAASRWQR